MWVLIVCMFMFCLFYLFFVIKFICKLGIFVQLNKLINCFQGQCIPPVPCAMGTSAWAWVTSVACLTNPPSGPPPPERSIRHLAPAAPPAGTRQVGPARCSPRWDSFVLYHYCWRYSRLSFSWRYRLSLPVCILYFTPVYCRNWALHTSM